MELLVEDDDAGVRILTLNRPHKRNALDTALTQQLLEALRAADAQDGVGCVVLTGAAPIFSAGADISEFAGPAADPARLQARSRLTMALHLLIPSMNKPVIAAVNGAALGAGAGLALAADMVIMSDTASIGYPETRRAIVPTLMIPNLVRQVGPKAAFELISLGQAIDAARAAHIGIANRVVAAPQLLDEARRSASELARLDPATMKATKRLFHDCLDLSLQAAFERASEAASPGSAVSRR